MFAKWLAWWRGEPRRSVVLYTRKDCPLCDEAWVVLQRAARRYWLALRRVEVDSDEELARKYGLHVPVVLIDARVRFRGHVNPVLLNRLLQAAPGSSRGGEEETTQADGGS